MELDNVNLKSQVDSIQKQNNTLIDDYQTISDQLEGSQDKLDKLRVDSKNNQKELQDKLAEHESSLETQTSLVNQAHSDLSVV